MISRAHFLDYFQLVLVVGGMLYTVLRYGQMRLPLQRGHPALFVSQLVITVYFSVQLGVNSMQADRAFLFYLDLFMVMVSLASVIHRYLLLERRASAPV